jgi:hypothetical protein
MFVGAIIGGDTLQSKSKATRPAFVTSSTAAPVFQRDSAEKFSASSLAM